MKFTKFLKKIKKRIYDMFEDENTGHDILHLKRVLKTAVYLQKHEGGDLYVIAVSALVHDVHRLMSDQKGEFVPPEDSIDVVKRILLDCDVDKNKLNEILEIVKNHSDKQNKNYSLETKIVQDADALDSIGKIGLERTLKYCKANNIPIVNLNYPLECEEYIPDINPISACHYLHNTNIPKYNSLHTKTAIKIGADKTQILKKFVKRELEKAEKTRI